MVRFETFDVAGEIVTDGKTQVKSNRLAAKKDEELNKRVSSTNDTFVDFKQLVLQEPGLSQGGVIQVTLRFDVADKSHKGGGK